jgi:hypothetical protein
MRTSSTSADPRHLRRELTDSDSNLAVALGIELSNETMNLQQPLLARRDVGSDQAGRSPDDGSNQSDDSGPHERGVWSIDHPSAADRTTTVTARSDLVAEVWLP